MPSIEENLERWNEDYDWSLAGDAWSGPWGDARTQWYGSLYPRLQGFLPAKRILEIAPGFGRWTEFLLDHCEELIAVDVTPKCVEACQHRFADRAHASFFTNDGSTLPMVEDRSIDLAFSFDSLVHVEAEPLGSYLQELGRCLSADGVGVIHHSNYGSYQNVAHLFAPLQSTFDRLPVPARAALLRTGIYRGAHWRAPSVTAERFVEMAQAAGLHCIGQELINWEGGVQLLDSISVVTRPGSVWDRPNVVVHNRLFRQEARSTRRSAAAYRAVGRKR